MGKVVFIEERDFDMYEHKDYPDGEYEGFSWLSVYNIPGFNEGYIEDEEGDMEEVDPWDYDTVGTVLVGFDRHGDAEILDKNNIEGYIEVYYPPL